MKVIINKIVVNNYNSDRKIKIDKQDLLKPNRAFNEAKNAFRKEIAKDVIDELDKMAKDALSKIKFND